MTGQFPEGKSWDFKIGNKLNEPSSLPQFHGDQDLLRQKPHVFHHTIGRKTRVIWSASSWKGVYVGSFSENWRYFRIQSVNVDINYPVRNLSTQKNLTFHMCQKWPRTVHEGWIIPIAPVQCQYDLTKPFWFYMNYMISIGFSSACPKVINGFEGIHQCMFHHSIRHGHGCLKRKTLSNGAVIAATNKQCREVSKGHPTNMCTVCM